MTPIKLTSKNFKDARGNLIEVIPEKIKKRFNYCIVTNSKKNVLRGMHYNKNMNEEKLVFILEGKIFDVTINLNKGKNFGKIFYYNLKKNDILLIPKGYAHGYICQGKQNSILYLLNKRYSKRNNAGFIWSDKNFNIKWVIKKPILSIKDRYLKEYKN
jgi:dTDP-4-dehydrorhamnose 3,5-epimerase